jgi:hypothetical protein
MNMICKEQLHGVEPGNSVFRVKFIKAIFGGITCRNANGIDHRSSIKILCSAIPAVNDR